MWAPTRLSLPTLESLGAWWPRVAALARYGTDGYPPAVRRRLMILNLFAYLIAIFTFGYSLQHLFVDYRTFAPVIWINFALAASAALVPFMHRFGEIAGALLISAAELLGLLLLGAYLGSPSGVHIQYIIGAAAPFFVFGLSRRWLSLALVAICLVMHLAVWVLFPAPQPEFAAHPAFIRSIYVSAIVTTFAITAAIVHYAFRLAEAAEAETDALLRNILPEPIVERLKANPGVTIADSFSDASVLFADMRGFVPVALSLGPARTVELLNRLVRELDALAAAHGVEKIKTIGDAYMAAAGVPEPQPEHALRLARFGLAMHGVIGRLAAEVGKPLELRVGIASGPLLAGVIGVRRLTYDVWGDTVNLAARLESNGVPGRVQVSARTRELIEAHFKLEARGEIEVKGLGAQPVWLIAA
ncbi:MAG TPA: adenylate/guanylate cyclase domain-containing protein [Hyphomicrobiaceae bacterium]|nr:adenylate/guanylate cyclase domain-containing protein [Hyphomicrobiaceae bacterium]